MGKKKDKEKDSKGKAEKTKQAKARKKRDKQTKKQLNNSTKAPAISALQRAEMIAEAAYFIAEKHGFDPARSTQDWQEAERQIDDMFETKQD
jgi:hypothetical protein